MYSFESQFTTRKQIDFHGRSISFVDVIPPIQKSNIPIFIAFVAKVADTILWRYVRVGRMDDPDVKMNDDKKIGTDSHLTE